jgi:hypothetical protein
MEALLRPGYHGPTMKLKITIHEARCLIESVTGPHCRVMNHCFPPGMLQEQSRSHFSIFKGRPRFFTDPVFSRMP